MDRSGSCVLKPIKERDWEAAAPAAPAASNETGTFGRETGICKEKEKYQREELFRVAVKALTGLPAESAGADHLAQQRAGAVL